jgi:phosphoglycolate phosphatase
VLLACRNGNFVLMKQYSNYIFDLDGTLLNTLDDLCASCNYALKTMGFAQRTTDEVRRFVGNGVAKLMERAVPDGTSAGQTAEALAVFRKHYLDHGLDTTRPYDGIPELLTALRQRGNRVAVVSNKFNDATRQLCAHFFPDTVEVAIGETAAIRKKPAPDTVMEAMRQLGVDAAGTVYVGDSDVDVMTARNSGLPCISVLWGFRDRAFLEDCGATVFAAKPADILY